MSHHEVTLTTLSACLSPFHLFQVQNQLHLQRTGYPGYPGSLVLLYWLCWRFLSAVLCGNVVSESKLSVSVKVRVWVRVSFLWGYLHLWWMNFLTMRHDELTDSQSVSLKAKPGSQISKSFEGLIISSFYPDITTNTITLCCQQPAGISCSWLLIWT